MEDLDDKLGPEAKIVKPVESATRRMPNASLELPAPKEKKKSKDD